MQTFISEVADFSATMRKIKNAFEVFLPKKSAVEK